MSPGLLITLVLSVIQGIALLAAYISNNAFPQPLKEEEESAYLKRLQKGDHEARNVLVEHNLRLVAHITKRL